MLEKSASPLEHAAIVFGGGDLQIEPAVDDERVVSEQRVKLLQGGLSQL